MSRRDVLRAAPVAVLAALAVVAVVKHKRARVSDTHANANANANAHADDALRDPRRGAGAPIARAPVNGHASTPPVRMQHGDRKRCARSTAKGSTSLRVKWRAPLGAAIEAQVVSSPDESTLYAATLGGDLVALARADGTVKFRVPLGGRSYATPCVDDRGNVYSASDAKKLFAVRADGHVAWTLDLEGEGDTACALADDGTVVLAAGRELLGVTTNGDVSWRFSARGKIFTAPAIDDDGRVIAGSQDHRVYAVSHGKKVWATDVGADVDGSPAIDDDGAIVVGTDGGEVIKLDKDGSVRWSQHVGGFVRGALSIARGGDVLAGVYGPHSRLARLDAASGAEIATFDIAGPGAPEFGVHGGALEDAAGTLFFGAQDDRFYALATNGAATSVLATDDVDAPATLMTDGALVVASDDGAVYYLEP